MTTSTLKRLANSELLDKYCDEAINHRSASRNGDYKRANPAARKLGCIFAELNIRGADKQLLDLLGDPRAEVRGWAAAHCLEIAPERAIGVLEEIASGPKSLEEFSAKMVLREWMAGSRVLG